MKVGVISTDGKTTGKEVTLAKGVFGVEPNDHAIYLDVKQYLANQRQGTSKSKERGEIKGSRRKLKKQKGTGTARFGDIKNPLFRGGGRVFGPKPRNYISKLNKKVKSIARNSALSYKAQNEDILVLSEVNFANPKTKEYSKMLESIGVGTNKSLLVMEGDNENVHLSSRNIQKARVTTLEGLNTYQILNSKKLIFTEKALAAINK